MFRSSTVFVPFLIVLFIITFIRSDAQQLRRAEARPSPILRMRRTSGHPKLQPQNPQQQQKDNWNRNMQLITPEEQEPEVGHKRIKRRRTVPQQNQVNHRIRRSPTPPKQIHEMNYHQPEPNPTQNPNRNYNSVIKMTHTMPKMSSIVAASSNPVRNSKFQENQPSNLQNNSTNSSSSVYVVSGLSKYALLHLIPPPGSQLQEIQNSVDEKRYLRASDSKNLPGSGTGDKTGLAIILVEFDVSDGDEETYETIVETEN